MQAQRGSGATATRLGVSQAGVGGLYGQLRCKVDGHVMILYVLNAHVLSKYSKCRYIHKHVFMHL